MVKGSLRELEVDVAREVWHAISNRLMVEHLKN